VFILETEEDKSGLEKGFILQQSTLSLPPSLHSTMSTNLLAVNGDTYVGLTINNTITHFDATVPEENLYNHSPYPSIEDLVQHTTREPWVRLGDSGSTWRGATGSDQLFMAAVQAYFSQVH
jgi:hypothetical protein